MHPDRSLLAPNFLINRHQLKLQGAAFIWPNIISTGFSFQEPSFVGQNEIVYSRHNGDIKVTGSSMCTVQSFTEALLLPGLMYMGI